MAEIADADFGRLRRERMRRDDAKADCTDPPTEHGSSLSFHLDLTDDGGPLAREACSPAGPYNLQHDRIVLACKPLFLSSMIWKSGYRFSERSCSRQQIGAQRYLLRVHDHENAVHRGARF